MIIIVLCSYYYQVVLTVYLGNLYMLLWPYKFSILLAFVNNETMFIDFYSVNGMKKKKKKYGYKNIKIRTNKEK